MISRRRLNLSRAAACVAFAAVSLAAGRNLHGADQKAARTRAEIERKSREIKKTVAEHQRKVREELNLSDPAKRGVGASMTKPNSSSLPDLETLRKKMKTSDPRAFGTTNGSARKKEGVGYNPKRGQDYAFQVEMLARDGGLQKQWTGRPYFAGVFPDVGRSFAEMFCIGSLECQVRSSSDRPWSRASLDDIELPQSFMFGSHGVMNTRTTSLFDRHTLPMQLSAILPAEELIFPRLPTFSDSSRDESKKHYTFYLRGGQKNILGDVPTTTLDGESRHMCRLEQESSSTPQIINERGFDSPSQGVSMNFRQVGRLNASEGMITSVELDYRLKLDGDSRMVVKVSRLQGDDLAQARADALKKLPRSKWPPYFRRVPVEGDEFGRHLAWTESDVPVGRQVAVSIDISERDAHGARDYLAQTVAGAPRGKVRVRLDDSDEVLDVSASDIRLPK